MLRAQVALSLANLAALMRAQGRHALAEGHLRRALAIREDALGPDHPLVNPGCIDTAPCEDIPKYLVTPDR